jgi:hypothetical protein
VRSGWAAGSWRQIRGVVVGIPQVGSTSLPPTQVGCNACVCWLCLFGGVGGAMVCGGLPGGVLGWFEFVVGCCAAAKSIESSAAKEAYRRVLAASWKRLRVQTLNSRKTCAS